MNKIQTRIKEIEEEINQIKKGCGKIWSEYEEYSPNKQRCRKCGTSDGFHLVGKNKMIRNLIKLCPKCGVKLLEREQDIKDIKEIFSEELE